MRLVKILSIVSAVAVAAMAFFGVSTAMGEFNTALCKSSESLECAEENLVEEFAILAETTLIETSIGNISCLHSRAAGKVENEGLLAEAPEALHIQLKGLTWSECDGPCQLSTHKLPLLDVLKTGEDLGTVTALNFEVRLTCSLLMDCYYGGTEVKGFTFESAEHTEGAGNGMLTANKLVMERTKGFCPETVQMTVLYEPTSGFFPELCWADEEPCAAENQVEGFTMLATKEVLETDLGTVLCLHSKATAETAEVGVPIIKVTGLTWNECGTNEEHENCEVTNVKLPLFGVTWTAEDLGTATALETEIHVVCPKEVDCYYGGVVKGFTVESAKHTEGAGNGMFTANKVPVVKTKGSLCPSEANWEALYEPLKPLYLVGFTVESEGPIYLRS